MDIKVNKLSVCSILMIMIICISIFVFDLNIVYGSTLELKDENWGLHNAQVFEAQQITKGRDEIKVGIIDSGIYDHPMLEDVIDESLSKSFIENSAFVDITGHGTLVAGVIASQFNETLGMIGVAPNVKLVSLKITNQNYLPLDLLIDAINYAKHTLDDTDTTNDISILNYSGEGLYLQFLLIY